MGRVWYDHENYKDGRLRGYLVSRRESRNLVRHLHKRATGSYSCKEKPCPHDLTAYQPPEDRDWKAFRLEHGRGRKRGPAATQHKKARMQRKAEREGVSVTSLRARARITAA